MNPDPIFLCTKKAAKILDVSYRTLEQWRLLGKGPKYSKLGRSVRYRFDDLMQFAA
ncbi:helix-turn-helix domain-containing protein [Caulobacter sp. Root1472]|uniref:helix-turn-helix transcriptional regulator n=1 Tax=Caulobacter sp. Root1472 TaxID=1736470 RepID=UPI000A925017